MFYQKRDWDLYEARCLPWHVQWLKGLSPTRALDLCQSISRLGMEYHSGAGTLDRLCDSKTREKIAARTRWCPALQRFDQSRGR